MRKAFIGVAAVSLLLSLISLMVWEGSWWLFLIVCLLVGLGIYDMTQTRHALLRTYPVVGHGRWLMEFVRPFLRQYFFESETDGVPVNRMFRSVVYQRAKGERDTIPYGTKVDTQRVGYEWLGHSLTARHVEEGTPVPKVTIGGPQCRQPYQASLLNVSAMSFGAISNNAVRALNRGAKTGGFYHNTGEGSVSPYHLEYGGDLVWQIGTGYFGCRDSEGRFSPARFQQVARQDSIKMIEIKLSQGAKPGHGGILPADKNTQEIARIRAVEPGTRVDSPPTHSAFSNPLEMMQFVSQLRELSEGKPIGLKLSVGLRSEFVAMCKAMLESGVTPDFITVDGGEGGTGAAPLEYTNSVGMPLREALAFVCDVLHGFDLKKDVRVIASGKVFTGFHLVKNLALGADLCNSARGMMLSLGCVQSLECNTNRCPTGIATQNPDLVSGLVVEDKYLRVARFQAGTVKAAMEILASAGLRDGEQIDRSHIYRRVSHTEILRYDQIYPDLQSGCFLTGGVDHPYQKEITESRADSFYPVRGVAKGNVNC